MNYVFEFYYDPVLGLRYNFHDSFLIVDVALIPQHQSIEEFMLQWDYYMKEHSPVFCDPERLEESNFEIISNV